MGVPLYIRRRRRLNRIRHGHALALRLEASSKSEDVERNFAFELAASLFNVVHALGPTSRKRGTELVCLGGRSARRCQEEQTLMVAVFV